jgi:hypothetical protein
MGKILHEFITLLADSVASLVLKIALGTSSNRIILDPPPVKPIRGVNAPHEIVTVTVPEAAPL